MRVRSGLLVATLVGSLQLNSLPVAFSETKTEVTSVAARTRPLGKHRFQLHWISWNNNGAPCKRDGTMTFAITGKRKYWRLQEMQSPCDETTDYVDIFLR